MGESSERPEQDDKAVSDKNKKKTLKTRAQLEALENFYDEHKYPTEAMKLLAAERIGLTEKQISSWFCHRRLKDKKILSGEVHVNGRQDRSSGIIQDIGSGQRQDSCGSTKQSDDRNLGPIEVQSRRVNGQQVLDADLTYARGNHSRMDDTLSGSSSSPRNIYSNGDHKHMVTSKFSTRSLENNVKGGGLPRPGPSGYLKVKGRVENAAIVAVKRQLGPLYRDDGPLLGIEFDPLPQGAFESLTHQQESFYPIEIVSRHSPDVTYGDDRYLSKPYHVKERNFSLLEDVPRIHKQPTSNSKYGYTSNLSSHKSVREGKSLKMARGSEHSRTSFLQMHKQEFPLPNHTATDMHDDPAREMPRYGGFRVGALSAPQHFQPFGREVKPKRAEPWCSPEIRRKVVHGDRVHSSYSDMTIEGQGNDGFKDQGFFRKAAKVNNFLGARSKFDDDRDALQQNISMNNQMHRANDQRPPHAGKVSREGVPHQLNQITRSGAQTPSCSEDDENADTTSSED